MKLISLALVLLPYWSGGTLAFHTRPGLPMTTRSAGERIVLEAPPSPPGQARAWTALEDAPRLSGREHLILHLRGNGQPVRFSLFYLTPGSELYRWKDTTVVVPDTLFRLVWPLQGARKVFASNFPGALSASGHAPLILIVENAEKAPFRLEILRLELEGRP